MTVQRQYMADIMEDVTSSFQISLVTRTRVSFVMTLGGKEKHIYLMYLQESGHTQPSLLHGVSRCSLVWDSS